MGNVGNNTERGVNQYYQVKYFLFQFQMIYTTYVNKIHVYTQLQIKKPAYTIQTYNLKYSTDFEH